MRVWAVHPVWVYERLQREGVLHYDFGLSDYNDLEEFVVAYDWMAEQMRKRIGEPPAGVKYPFWAWHTLDWKHKKVDLRTLQFRYYDKPSVCLELEIPDNQVLLNDEDGWYSVLGDRLSGEANNESEWEAEQAWFDALPKKEQENAKRKSWEKIFDVTPFKNDWNWRGRDIQATFWELRLDQVVDARYFCWPTVKR